MGSIYIDADIVAYEAAAQGETKIDWQDGQGEQSLLDERLALDIAVSIIDKIERYCGSAVILCFSGKDNFRKKINPNYKANRIGRKRPTLLLAIHEELKVRYTTMTEGCLEGDDLMGVLSTSDGDSVIASTDKDLLNVPGWHFNWRRPDDDVFHVSDMEAEWNFYTQVLVGDSCDGYPGCPGVGIRTAERLLENTRGDGVAAWGKILDAFDRKGLTETDALTQARMAFILQKGYYNFENGEVKLWVPHT